MAIYLGNTLVTPSLGHNPLWWANVGENPEFLYEANYLVYLKDMSGHDSISPTTSEKTLSHPAGLFTYTNNNGTVTNSTAGNNVVYDRYGSDYHNGEQFNFELYSYAIITDCFSVDTYTTDESQMTIAHTLKNSFSSVTYYGLTIKVLTNGTVVYYGDEGYTPTIYYNTMNRYHNLYRNASKNVAGYINTYAGIYAVAYAPTLSSTASFTPGYINFMTPYYRYRTHDTMHVAAAFNSLDHNTTYVKVRQRLYRMIRFPGLAEGMLERLGYMFTNTAFPTELI